MKTVVRKIKGGFSYDKEIADSKGVLPGTEWEVLGGDVHSFSSTYRLKGVDGDFNTSMFSGSWEDHKDVMTLHYLKLTKKKILEQNVSYIYDGISDVTVEYVTLPVEEAYYWVDYI